MGVLISSSSVVFVVNLAQKRIHIKSHDTLRSFETSKSIKVGRQSQSLLDTLTIAKVDKRYPNPDAPQARNSTYISESTPPVF